MSSERTQLITQTSALALPDEQQFRRDFAAIARFQSIVRSQMIDGHDFGVIPGTGNKPTLLKPGAEKIAKLLGLADEYEIVSQAEDWEKGFFRYLIRSRLVHIDTGRLVAQGLGECNSMESKYRWRWVSERDLPKGVNTSGLVSQERRSKTGAKWTVYRLPNDDIYSQVNTILKMAKKRALVDAALSAGRLSDIFTQDIEDMPKEAIAQADDAAPAPPAPAATPPPADAGWNELAGQGKAAPPPAPPPAPPASPRPDDGHPMTDPQKRAIIATAKKAQFTDSDLADIVKRRFGLDDWNKMTVGQARSIISDIQRIEGPPPKEAA